MICLHRRFLCNVCDMPNEVPVDYFAGLDQAGRRLDEAQRPELGQGSVEYVAPQEYMVRIEACSPSAVAAVETKERAGIRYSSCVDLCRGKRVCRCKCN